MAIDVVERAKVRTVFDGCLGFLSVRISCFALQLVEMGFAEVRATKGLMFGAGPDMESAVNWLMDHQARVANSVSLSSSFHAKHHA